MEDSRHNSVLSDIERIPELEYAEPRRVREATPAAPPNGWTAKGWLLLEHRNFIRKVTIRALLLSTILVFLIPKSFESTARIMPPEQTDGGTMLALLASRSAGGVSSGGGSSGLGSLAGNLLGSKSTGALYVNLVRSRTVQDKVIEKANLQKVYRAKYREDARKTLDARTTIEEDRKSGIITISVLDHDPNRARDIVQAYLASLDTLLSSVSTSSARRERMFIEQRLVAVKADLEDAEHQFSRFASKNSALDIKEQGKAMVEAAAVLQGQLMAAQSELQGLEQIYTSSNVRVRSLHARVAELQNQLQKFDGNNTSISADGDDSRKGDYPTIKQLPLLGVEWADLYRRMKIQETVYELLNQQYELTRIQEARDIPSVRIVDPAEVPEKKSWPPRLLIIAGVTALAFLLAAIWVVLANYWKSVDPADPRKTLAKGAIDKLWKSRQRSLSPLDRFSHKSGG